MNGISPKLPIQRNSTDGYALNKSFFEAIKQNFKHLVLTNPGERMMDPNFGVGLKRYLFENGGVNTYGQISSKVRQQAGVYMPYVEVNNLIFSDSEGVYSTSGGFVPRQDPYNTDYNTVQVRIIITIKPLKKQTTIDLKF